MKILLAKVAITGIAAVGLMAIGHHAPQTCTKTVNGDCQAEVLVMPNGKQYNCFVTTTATREGAKDGIYWEVRHCSP